MLVPPFSYSGATSLRPRTIYIQMGATPWLFRPLDMALHVSPQQIRQGGWLSWSRYSSCNRQGTWVFGLWVMMVVWMAERLWCGWLDKPHIHVHLYTTLKQTGYLHFTCAQYASVQLRGRQIPFLLRPFFRPFEKSCASRSVTYCEIDRDRMDSGISTCSCLLHHPPNGAVRRRSPNERHHPLDRPDAKASELVTKH